MSETATCRSVLSLFCTGAGIDIGAGGDAIVPWAICIDRREGAIDRAHVGQSPTHLVADAASLPFEPDTLDFVYSSHCLEDFVDTAAILREWLRVLRPGGNLVLFLPDQPTYAAFCAANGSLPNQAHKHDHFSLAYVRMCLASLGIGTDDEAFVAWPFPGNDYSFALVIRKPHCEP